MTDDPVASIQIIFDATSAIASLIAAAVAIKVYEIAENFREVEWIRQQNDAWNDYNVMKFGYVERFKEAENVLFGESETDLYSLDYEAEAVVHLRLNLMEKDARALMSGSIIYGDRKFLIHQIRKMIPNRTNIIRFLVKEGYDDSFVELLESIMDTYAAGKPEPTQEAIELIFQNCNKTEKPHILARLFRS